MGEGGRERGRERAGHKVRVLTLQMTCYGYLNITRVTVKSGLWTPDWTGMDWTGMD